MVHELQVAQVREALEELLNQVGPGEEYAVMVAEVLTNWSRIENFIDYALLNHGYPSLTIMLYKGGNAIFIKFMKDRFGEWSFEEVAFGKKVNWGYRWEYDLEKMEPHEIRKHITVKTPEV